RTVGDEPTWAAEADHARKRRRHLGMYGDGAEIRPQDHHVIRGIHVEPDDREGDAARMWLADQMREAVTLTQAEARWSEVSQPGARHRAVEHPISCRDGESVTGAGQLPIRRLRGPGKLAGTLSRSVPRRDHAHAGIHGHHRVAEMHQATDPAIALNRV